jgi:hypothetical protein
MGVTVKELRRRRGRRYGGTLRFSPLEVRLGRIRVAKETLMLGEQIGEGTGKVLVRRVLPGDGPPRVEVSGQGTGKLLGVEMRGSSTYTATVRPDGTLFIEGQGIDVGKGGETASWNGQGVGRLVGPGGVRYRGAIYYQTQAEVWKHLNDIAVVFEYEADADGNGKLKAWEWR